ncbi:copper resistance CopC family protein [Meiothermus granaticius]|uniref:CopC domain protein n=1 Tax=Meiothermus granaticius NBRC 107808 TaxID=1227551 RepID=A0A399FEG5_9DEIN|nr:copper resistance protein CopC [Meiothermus granaticius]MBI5813068.1 copper resistance protein CopC [Allomeiothermus silvanus]MCL6526411.1 copper resistance protein CopC [Thermaceae bacterium]RIH93492.1 CopC domain protein [Meiothermus granaticius NBRC 107808]GEM85987.1 hypothetical protein MGR01S_06120 [Meiothermus granaticius NBRC 107808]
MISRYSLMLATALVSSALAHAGLQSSTPAANSVLQSAPTQVVLNMEESVEMRLSTFKVYPLEATPQDLQSFRRLNALAEPLFERVLRLKNDQPQRADSGLKTTSRTGKQVVVGLKAGAYVVMWQVLSTDSHRTSDYYVFVVRP